MTGMILDCQFKPDNMQKLASSGFATATDLADYLVYKFNFPFRKAHHMVGALVKEAENLGLDDLNKLDLAIFQKYLPELNSEIYQILTIQASLKSRNSHGGTAPDQIKQQLLKVKQELE